jgi:hypothetical protein
MIKEKDEYKSKTGKHGQRKNKKKQERQRQDQRAKTKAKTRPIDTKTTTQWYVTDRVHLPTPG